MALEFKPGEALTAAKLNELVRLAGGPGRAPGSMVVGGMTLMRQILDSVTGDGGPIGIHIGYVDGTGPAATINDLYDRTPGDVTVFHHIVGDATTMKNLSQYTLTDGSVIIGISGGGDCWMVCIFC